MKLTSVTIPIPYKGPGNTIMQRPVAFDLFRDQEAYVLVPCLNESERRIANLPESLAFTIGAEGARSLRGFRDGNLHVITDAVQVLKAQGVEL